MLSLRRLQSVVLVVLAVLLICTVGAYALETTWGYNDDVYWDVTVRDVYRSGNNTYSSHQYYIENDKEDVTVTLIEQEFKHRVMQTYDDGRSDSERIVRRNADMTDTVRIPAGTSAIRDYDHEVDISGLDTGTYYINAYTRINLAGIAEDPEPKAEETSSDFDIDD